jgi:hypothetical protein
VEYFHGYAHHSCTVGRIATNSRTGSVGCIATNSRYASVGCLATNSRTARFSAGPSKCYIWEGPYKIIKRINVVVYRIQRNPRSRMMAVHLDRLAPYRETARDGLKEGAVGTAGDRPPPGLDHR